MSSVKVIVLRAAGINCDAETEFAWHAAGAEADRIHVKRLIEQPSILARYQILTVPGGFSYGDDIASGRILGNQLEHHLGNEIRSFIEGGGLVLGICNGFQVLVRMGLLPGPDCGRAATLTLNDSGRYEDRWVHLRAEISHSPFLEKDAVYHLPVAHGEGRVVIQGGEAGAGALAERGRIALRYVSEDGGPPSYPQNPNGSTAGVAGLTDSTGRVLGLMPHPERNMFPTHSPRHMPTISTASGFSADCDGAKLFLNAVTSFH